MEYHSIAPKLASLHKLALDALKLTARIHFSFTRISKPPSFDVDGAAICKKLLEELTQLDESCKTFERSYQSIEFVFLAASDELGNAHAQLIMYAKSMINEILHETTSIKRIKRVPPRIIISLESTTPESLWRRWSEIDDYLSLQDLNSSKLKNRLEIQISKIQVGCGRRLVGDDKSNVDEKTINLAEMIQKDRDLKLAGCSTRHPSRERNYHCVAQRKRDNPEQYQAALDYLDSQKPKV